VTTERLLVRSSLALAVAGLLVLALFALRGGWQVRVSPVAFLLLVSAELVLLDVATSTRPRAASAARMAIFLLPLTLAVGLRIYQALGTHDLLEWDETYYMSMAVTAADGRGLYPYVFGFGATPIMGGPGYAAYVYALAVLLAGPTVMGLRVVSLLASLAGLVCVWLLVRMWYGAGTAWMAVALTPALRLFVMSNSVRMDSMAFAYVTGAILVSAVAFQRWDAKRWHLFAGLVFGLGLQVHIDTAVTAVACGVVYLVIWLRQIKAQGRVPVPAQMLSFIAGWLIGLAVFVCFNILPDPASFYKTTVLIRVDATGWYSKGTSSAFGSFLDPRILLSKELSRYTVLFRTVPRIELLLGAVAIGAALVRRAAVDKVVLTIIAAVLVSASVVLNNASPLYYIHVIPALIIPMAPLLTHGLARQRKVSTAEIGVASMLAFIVVVSALIAVNNAKTVGRAARPAALEAADAELVSRVRSVAGPGCTVAGDAGLYVRYFADYPYFVSSRPTEVKYAMLYYGLTSEADYWAIKAPEVIVARGPLSEGMSAYIAGGRLRRVEDGIWAVPDGCKAADRQSR
jgi:hypothetical protein